MVTAAALANVASFVHAMLNVVAGFRADLVTVMRDGSTGATQ
jgi:hypothetical protein